MCGPSVPAPPLSRTKWTRLVHPSVLTGHVWTATGSADARGPAERSAAHALGALGAGTRAAFERARAHFVAQVRVSVGSDTDTEAPEDALVGARRGIAAHCTQAPPPPLSPY